MGELETNVYVLPEDFSIRAIENIHTELKSMEIEDSLTLDGSRVIDIDCSGLQMLVSLVCKVHANGAKVVWLESSERLKEIASLLGMTSVLEISQ